MFFCESDKNSANKVSLEFEVTAKAVNIELNKEGKKWVLPVKLLKRAMPSLS